MTYQAFYRVYRPQSFREMSGQSHVKRTLQNALLANKTTHAYLFSGPRGTGKTSTAKVFAKALNCEHAPTDEPCNECATCLSITNGSHPDVIEFDAASNSRVEEMREIIEKVRFAPASARFKVYIIDEVHMLSTSAFNALLKTLEEPPAHVVFILATTEPHKLPATIISRCQRFDFKRLSSIDLLERMKVVLEDIELPYDEQALKVISQSAAGGMRDALSMLDQVVSFSGDKLTLDDALFVTGSISQDVFYDLAKALSEKDIAQVLALLEKLISEGKDAVRLSEDLITFFRDLLLIQTAPGLEDLLELASSDEKFKTIANQFTMDTLYGYVDILSKTQQEMRFSHHSKIYLETALLKMAQFAPGQSIIQTNSQMMMQAAGESPNVEVLEAKIASLEEIVHQLQQGGMQQHNAAPAQQRQRPKVDSGVKINVGRIQEVLKVATKKDLQMIKSAWADVINQLQRSQSALLEEAEPVAATSNAFVLKLKQAVYCTIGTNNGTFSAMTTILQQLTGSTYEVVVVPEENWLKIRTDYIRQHGLGKQVTSSEESPEDHINESTESLFVEEQIISEDPLVVEAEKIFGKDFVEVVED
ncbi:DNA polymerase III subunit gamma/tau [Viridibacillus sp. YIM B01967]|uniref:DNA-directed DNA polymerase n=1 Tax=Viridibacillus soli TaxID=2798301 RepID=A0ABS1HCX9_9BACL|nr:DNA polymerase III subunit gamma/tau [Viridibacillus soli]MBK3497311.1 DNA polymerase III subunit gamma/tau [Viridibacillus soli]